MRISGVSQMTKIKKERNQRNRGCCNPEKVRNHLLKSLVNKYIMKFPILHCPAVCVPGEEFIVSSL